MPKNQKLSTRERRMRIVSFATIATIIFFLVLLANIQPETEKTFEAAATPIEKVAEADHDTDAAEVATSPLTPQADLATYKVVRVIDGDTMKLNMNGKEETVRVIGIDTPETVRPNEPVECFGMEASNKAKEVLTGQTVRFEDDPTQDTRDKYDRLLGHVFLENGQNFGELMLAEGYAYEFTYNMPYKYQSAYKAAVSFARGNKKGLWADGVCD